MDSSLTGDDLWLTPKEFQKYSTKRPPKLEQICKNPYESFSTPKFLLISPDNSFDKSTIQDPVKESIFSNNFTITDILGEGSFGRVYKAANHNNGQMYAIKVAKTRFRNEAERKIRLAEVEIHEQFSGHDNIVKLIHAWEERRVIYMQLELCQINLQDLSRDSKVCEKTIWIILVDILLALKYIHERNYVHLDVKLDNILLGYDGRYKLGDFGLVYNTLSNETKDPVEGDSKYLAAEVLAGIISPAADIFSLGIAMLELGAHVILPNCGPAWQALRHDVLPNSQMGDLSPELIEIIYLMMKANHRFRPSANRLLYDHELLPKLPTGREILLKLRDIKNFMLRMSKYIVWYPLKKIASGFAYLTNYLRGVKTSPVIVCRNGVRGYEDPDVPLICSSGIPSPQTSRRRTRSGNELAQVKRQLFSAGSSDESDQ